MISRAANRTSSERSSSTSLRPAISALSFSRVRSDAGILSIGVLLCGGRSPNRTSLVRLIRRRCTPTLFPASLGLHLVLSRPRQKWRYLIPFASVMGILTVAIISRIQLGVRYVLPLYPMLAMTAGIGVASLF